MPGWSDSGSNYLASCISEILNSIILRKHLPETVFFYTRSLKSEDDKVPPMVYDHGKALFFLVEKN
jgi:hypothetical protein